MIFWRTGAVIYGYLRVYAPTNKLVDWIRSPRGLGWGLPVALLLAPAYLFAAAITSTILDRGGSAWLGVFVLLFIWNAMKFAWTAVWSVVTLARHAAGTVIAGLPARRQ